MDETWMFMPAKLSKILRKRRAVPSVHALPNICSGGGGRTILSTPRKRVPGMRPGVRPEYIGAKPHDERILYICRIPQMDGRQT